MTVSLCMIVRDEEAVLAECLESVTGLFDEVVIVDTGSRDNTRKIAKAHGARVYDFAWCDDFSAARNVSFAHATGDFLFWLDADDVLTEENREKFLRMKAELSPTTDVILMRYETGFDEDGKAIFTFLRERLIRRTLPHTWCGAVHEILSYEGREEIRDIAVTHRSKKAVYTDRNLRIYRRMTAQGIPFTARDLFYFGRELFYHGEDCEAKETLTTFLARPDGWIEDKLLACRLLGQLAQRNGESAAAVAAYAHTFLLAPPRGEVCTELGYLLLDNGESEDAVTWFEAALSLAPAPDARGFRDEELLAFSPLLGLCVAYDRLGNREQARFYNEAAGRLRPRAPAYLHNKAYFELES